MNAWSQRWNREKARIQWLFTVDKGPKRLGRMSPDPRGGCGSGGSLPSIRSSVARYESPRVVLPRQSFAARFFGSSVVMIACGGSDGGGCKGEGGFRHVAEIYSCTNDPFPQVQVGSRCNDGSSENRTVAY